MDHAYYEETAGVLRGLLIRLGDRLPGADLRWIDEYLDANELGLALEQMADSLSERGASLRRDERSDMIALADRMEMGDRFRRTLALIPEA